MKNFIKSTATLTFIIGMVTYFNFNSSAQSTIDFSQGSIVQGTVVAINGETNMVSDPISNDVIATRRNNLTIITNQGEVRGFETVESVANIVPGNEVILLVGGLIREGAKMFLNNVDSLNGLIR